MTCCTSTALLRNDFDEHIDRLRRLPKHADGDVRTLFESKLPIYIARAPGRLDVMGGIGDYSGSLVLELPIAEAAFAAVQTTNERDIMIASLRRSTGTQAIVVTITPSEWGDLRIGDLETARRFFARDPSSAWAAYVVGTVLVLLRETQSSFDGG